jgi:hypothetical protein
MLTEQPLGIFLQLKTEPMLIAKRPKNSGGIIDEAPLMKDANYPSLLQVAPATMGIK